MKTLDEKLAEANAIRHHIEELRREHGQHLYLALEPAPDHWTVTPKLAQVADPRREKVSPGSDPDAGQNLSTSFWRPRPANLIVQTLHMAHPGIACYMLYAGEWLWVG